MQKRNVIALTIAAACLAVFAPILLTFYVAHFQVVMAEEKRALLLAHVVLRRSEHIAKQVDTAFRAMATAGVQGCSESARTFMQHIQLESTYIEALGYASGNRLLCLSIGEAKNGLDLGPVTVTEPSGDTIRTDVKLPFSKDARFMLIGRGNYVAMIHNELPVDVMTASKDVVVAIFSPPQNQILVAHGSVRPEWLSAMHGTPETAFENKDQAVAIVAVLTSLKYNLGAIAALPRSEVHTQLRKAATVLVPIGVAGGIILMLAALQLSKTLVSMPTLIKSALKRKEFTLHYQPVVDLRTGKWTGAEALIRWHQPQGETVRPDLFIPIAEDCGLIHRLTERVIEILADDAATVFSRHPDFHIGINLSPQDLHSTTTVERLNQLSRRANAKSGNLIIEATERSLLEPNIVGETMDALKGLGFRFAVDDFGIGYSSLSYLGNFDFDLLKIDKTFVEALGTDSATSDVVPHIIAMAQALNLEIIAEGVETEAQAGFLREHGVQYAQGWLFAKAMPLADLLAELEHEP